MAQGYGCVEMSEISKVLQDKLHISKEEADQAAEELLDLYDIQEATSSGVPLHRHTSWVGAELPLRRSRPFK